MKKKLDWFEDRMLSTIQCTLPNGITKDVELIFDHDPAHYHDMQDRGYTFDPKIRVHRAPPTGCASCEG